MCRLFQCPSGTEVAQEAERSNGDPSHGVSTNEPDKPSSPLCLVLYVCFTIKIYYKEMLGVDFTKRQYFWHYGNNTSS